VEKARQEESEEEEEVNVLFVYFIIFFIAITRGFAMNQGSVKFPFNFNFYNIHVDI